MEPSIPIWYTDHMQDENKEIIKRIRALRISKKLKQKELNALANLPDNTICKIENGVRELTAAHLLSIAKALRVTTDSLLNTDDEYIFKQEVRIVQALREVQFEDLRTFLVRLEGDLYYASKNAEPERKQYLDSIVKDLIGMAKHDFRARAIMNDEVTRVRREWRKNV